MEASLVLFVVIFLLCAIQSGVIWIWLGILLAIFVVVALVAGSGGGQ